MPRSIFLYILIALYFLAVGCVAWAAPDRASWGWLVAAAIGGGFILAGLYNNLNLSKRTVLIVAVGLRVAFFFLPPSLSDDAYRYVWDGMLQQEGVNPYLYKPSDPTLTSFQEAPIYDSINSPDYFTVYPPLSQLIFRFGGLFYGMGWEVSYYAIKAVLVIFELGALLMLSRMIGPSLLILYAWHPLVLMETAGQAHTESAMLFFLVAAVWFTHRKQGSGASISLACAGWVKLYPFVFMPLLWRRFGWRGIVPGGIAAAALLWPYYHPQVLSNIRDSLDLYVRLFEFNAGVYYAIKKAYLIFTGDDWSKIIGPALRRLFVFGLPILYFIDYWRKWSLSRSLSIIYGFFLICSTTIHPWYFLAILMLAVMQPAMLWHWFWVATVAVGTYLLYLDGPYWSFVNVGWWGWFVLALAFYWQKPGAWFQELQMYRARRKVDAIAGFWGDAGPGESALDLGAGEGYVGREMADRWGSRVTLVDVVDMNKTSLRHRLYDGERLPVGPKSFDTTILYFVLHHTKNPDRVFREALRVTRKRVIVVESVYEGKWDLKLLTFLDVWANRLRSSRLMDAQEEHLTFKRAGEWTELFENAGGRIVEQKRKGKWIHKQHFYLIEA